MKKEPRAKVAILGGGPAAMSVAFWLTSTQALRDRFELDIYVPGWRLGGKCASGRAADDHQRIEEHGLHMLMGCYHNAFRTIRACYGEWELPAGHPYIGTGGKGDWTKAFTPHRDVVLQTPAGNGWASWPLTAPAEDELPGAPDHGACCAVAATQPTTLRMLMDALARWITANVASAVPQQYLDDVSIAATMHEIRAAIQAPPPDSTVAMISRQLERLVSGVSAAAVSMMNPAAVALAQAANAGGLGCTLTLGALAIGIMYGLWRDVFLQGESGIRAMNALDFRAWLRSCHLPQSICDSPPVCAVYDLAFGYRNGDSSHIANGSMAAGATLRFVLEAVLDYRGAPLWRMQAGMGDVVFTPMYQVLRERGVRIHFFHKVDAIGLAGGGVDTITVRRQADLSVADYDPFVEVKGLLCWPDEPRWEQLDVPAAQRSGLDYESSRDASGTALPPLKRGRDFDAAVVAFPPAVIGQVAALSGVDQRWDSMLASSRSVATVSFQLWMKRDLQQLGWPLGPTVVTAFDSPLDSWADMTHLIAAEDWGAASPPRSLHYFCGSIQDAVTGYTSPHAVADAWMSRAMGVLWPNLQPIPPDAASKQADFTRFNVLGSERYVQTPEGSVAFRLSSSAPMFGHLFLAGDWTLTRFSGGCVESAFESGMLAAEAICNAYP